MKIYNIINIETCKSTMETVKLYPINTLLYANEQTNGRGKDNRIWHSEKNDNLYMSLAIEINNEKLDYSNFSFLTALAMVETIKLFDKNINIQIKWPNDILINGKKIAGILLENDLFYKKLIIGLGLNINYYPDNVNFSATSLNKEGINVEKKIIIDNFLNKFDFYLARLEKDGFISLRDEIILLLYNYKKQISINNTQKEKISGIFYDLDIYGNLILQDEMLNFITIYSGDVFK